MQKLLIVLLFAGYAISATLSLEIAVEKSLKNSQDLEISRLGLDNLESLKRFENSNNLPKLNFDTAFYPTKTSVSSQNGFLVTSQNSATHIELSAFYNLWDGGITASKLKSLKYKIEENKNQNISKSLDITLKVKQIYFLISSLENQIKTSSQYEKFYDMLYKRAVAMRENGLKTSIDESRFYAGWLNAKNNLNLLTGEKNKQLFELKLLLGENDNFEIEENFLENYSNSLTKNIDFEFLKQQLLSNNPTLIGLDFKIKSSKDLIDAEKNKKYGTFNLSASYAHEDSIDNYNTRFVGANFNIPLYDGDKINSQIQQAVISHKIANEELSQAKQTLLNLLYVNYENYKNSINTIQSKENEVQVAQKNLELQEGRYTNGLGTYIEVVEAQALLEDGRNAITLAKLQKVIAWEQIKTLTNKNEK